MYAAKSLLPLFYQTFVKVLNILRVFTSLLYKLFMFLIDLRKPINTIFNLNNTIFNI